MQLQLVDAQSMFNLRNLLAHGQPDPEARRAFIALCVGQGLGQGACASAADHIQARLRDGDIQAQAPLPRESLIEQALPGADPVALQALALRTVVLPAQTLVNANTSDLRVLQAVTPAVDPARLQALLGERDAGHWLLNRGDIANRLQLSNEQMVVLPWVSIASGSWPSVRCRLTAARLIFARCSGASTATMACVCNACGRGSAHDRADSGAPAGA